MSIRVVLVHTSHPGNIGAVARAMKNMAMTELVLVAPQKFPDAEATARASGADDLLASARVCATLAEALDHCSLVIGASARARSLGRPPLAARDAACLAVAESQQHPVALVFGREHSGLSNEELDLCHYRLMVPVDAAFPSLNLAAAVLLVAYEIRMARLEGEALPAIESSAVSMASVNDMEGYYEHLERIMLATGFLNPEQPRQLMRRIRRLYQRARPDLNEINILRGILTSVEAFFDSKK